jgi:tetratricopeptide (TPR) repeat protein
MIVRWHRPGLRLACAAAILAAVMARSAAPQPAPPPVLVQPTRPPPPAVLQPARPQPVAPQPVAPQPGRPPAAGQRQLAARLAREGIELERQACQSEDYQQAQCAEAVQKLQSATQLDPSLTEAQVALAEGQWNRSFEFPKGALQRRTLQQGSLATLRQMVDANVADARPYYQLSIRVPDDATRRVLLERTVQLAPQNAPAHRDLAEVYLRTAQPEKAATTYQRYQVLRAGSGIEEARRDLVFANRLVALDRAGEAQGIAQTAFEHTRQEPRTARCNVFRSVHPGAVPGSMRQELTKILPACTNDAEFKRAIDLDRRGQKDEAIGALQAQVQANPQHAESYVMLERLYREKGETAKAAETVNRYEAVETDPGERCRRLKSERVRGALEPRARERVDRECPR